MSLGGIAVVLVLGISEGELPCSERELSEAVALRVELSTAAPDRVIVRAHADEVEIEFRGQVRRVEVGRTTGVAAARRIALAIADLVREPVTVGLPPLDDPPITATVGDAPIAPEPVFVSMEQPQAPAILIGAFVRGGSGASFERARFAASLDASLALGPIRAVVSAGGAFVPTVRSADFRIAYAALVTSAGLGLRLPGHTWEVRALGVVETYFVGGRGIDLTVDALPAVEGAFLYGFELGAGLEVSLGVSITGYLRRKRFTVQGDQVLSTERVAAALSLGLVWGSLE